MFTKKKLYTNKWFHLYKDQIQTKISKTPFVKIRIVVIILEIIQESHHSGKR